MDKIHIIAATDKLVTPKEYVLVADVNGNLRSTTVTIKEVNGIRSCFFANNFEEDCLSKIDEDVVNQFKKDILSWY